MIWYNSCPRCDSGTVVMDRDWYGWYLQCLQCAYMIDLDEPAQVETVLQTERLPEKVMAETA